MYSMKWTCKECGAYIWSWQFRDHLVEVHKLKADIKDGMSLEDVESHYDYDDEEEEEEGESEEQ